MALTATVYPTTVQRHIGSANENAVKTFYATAATSYALGDLVTIDGNGRVVKNTTTGGAVDGVVSVSVDNTNGANDERFVSVVVKGNVWVDAYTVSTGSFDDDFAIGTACGAITGGQALSPEDTLTTRQFTSLIIQAKPTAGAGITRKGLFYFRGGTKFI